MHWLYIMSGEERTIFPNEACQVKTLHLLTVESEKSHKDFWPGAGLLILEVLKTALSLNNFLEYFFFKYNCFKMLC